ncbi:hypothetical protein [Bdellovibrio sp. NC01]|uniref:hypothetical protein n=1 Tax=Bdellovibrio sp. NC01 TaxID=2220073 RepID=UPI0011594892|nr:hypothetical protein [Bdellovibrio sp. NC01]QDK36184.1 hypothetical protein DOE51_00480 [Bdellovibrio sp. NC01]
MNPKLLVKTVILVIALAAVIYGIKNLNSPEFATNSQDPNSAISALLGADVRPLNWCPAQVQKIEVMMSSEVRKNLSEAKDLTSLCEIMIGGVTADQLEKARFVKRAVATGSGGDERVLEQVPGASGAIIFRVQGMPFSSPMLEKALNRLEETK